MSQFQSSNPAINGGGALAHEAGAELGQLIDAEIDSVPPPAPTLAASQAARILLGASLVLIAFNLRPVFSSVSVLVTEITEATGMTSLGAGLLTTLPVLCLGAFAPFAPRLAQRIGTEKTLLLVLAGLALGTLLRGVGSLPLLFFGSTLAGACIAVANVLLPGLVKRDFPKSMAIMTGLYTMALCAGAAVAAGLTIPIIRWFGSHWTLGLAIWTIPVVLVLLMWLPQALRAKPGISHSGFKVVGLWKDRLAWRITMFMGLQSALAYSVFGWMAPMLIERGLSDVVAGGVVSFSIMTQVIACLLIPSIAVRRPNQSLICVALVGCATIGLLAILYAPLWSIWLWAAIQGFGQGGLIAVAMTVIVLRSPDSHIAAHLSGMAQCIGYMLAAIGPLLVGLIHNLTGSFAACGILFLALGLGAALNGWGAGRAGYVGARLVIMK